MAASSARANTSASGGYLAPSSEAPANDLDLDTILQALVAGITGLPGEMVLPRWQPTDGEGQVARRIPEVNASWAAISGTVLRQDDTPALIHRPDGDGSSVLRRQEDIEAVASFYGPRSDGYASLFRDGLWVAQNREAMATEGLSFVDCGPVRRVPDFQNTNPRRRADVELRLRRTIERVYPILNVLQGVGTIRADFGTDGTPMIENLPFQAPET